MLTLSGGTPLNCLGTMVGHVALLDDGARTGERQWHDFAALPDFGLTEMLLAGHLPAQTATVSEKVSCPHVRRTLEPVFSQVPELILAGLPLPGLLDVEPCCN